MMEMVEAMRPYSHPAREWVHPDTRRRECLVCGGPLTGIGSDMRHFGEAIRPLTPASQDVDAFCEAARVAESALDGILAPSSHITDADRARAIVEALYMEGALRTRRGTWKRPAAGKAA